MPRVERRPGERDGLRLERFQGLGERFGRAKRRGGGVVQIMRQPGGDFPQTGQFLLLLSEPLVILEAPGRRLDELENHRRADAEHFPEGLRGEPDQAGGPVAAHGGDGRVAAQERDLADEVPGRIQCGQPDLLSGRLPGDLELPIEQNVEGLSLPPLLNQRFARRERDLLAMPRQPRNLIGRQIGEERETSQLDFQIHGRTSMGTGEQGLTYNWIPTPPQAEGRPAGFGSSAPASASARAGDERVRLRAEPVLFPPQGNAGHQPARAMGTARKAIADRPIPRPESPANTQPLTASPPR